MVTTTDTNHRYTGTVDYSNATVTLPNGSITNTTARPRGAWAYDKLDHLHVEGTSFDLAIGATVATYHVPVFVASAVCVIQAFHAVMKDTGTTGTSDFQLYKNGTTVMSGGALNIDSGTETDGEVVDGTITTTALAADDIVSIGVTRNSSHDGTGAFAWVEISEVAPT